MNKRLLILPIVLLLAGAAFYFLRTPSPATSEAAAVEKKDEAEKVLADQTRISADAAERAGIRSEPAGPATLRETLSLSGRITLNQNTTARVKARFPGIVREVAKGLGETVTKGSLLAKVESNDSLLTYAISSPIDGVILERSTNVGDVAGDAPLFTIARLSDVWAEFNVFAGDAARVQVNQPMVVTSIDGKQSLEGPVISLLPVAEAASQTVVARVTIPNREGAWRSGMNVKGRAVLAERSVPVAIKSEAVQQDGQPVVYVQDGETYHVRPVRLGLEDNGFVEILEGLKAGERYVAAGSFVVKADIAKSAIEEE